MLKEYYSAIQRTKKLHDEYMTSRREMEEMEERCSSMIINNFRSIFSITDDSISFHYDKIEKEVLVERIVRVTSLNAYHLVNAHGFSIRNITSYEENNSLVYKIIYIWRGEA